MRKFIFACLCSISLLANANETDSNVAEYIVMLNGDTLFGSIEYINYNQSTPKVSKRFKLTAPDGKITKIKKNHIRSFRTNGYLYERFYLVKSSSSKSGFLREEYNIDKNKGVLTFLKVVEKGTLSYYILETWEQGESLMLTYDLLIKNDNRYFTRVTLGVFGIRKKILHDYINDCKILSTKAENKEITSLHEIVIFYNNQCQ
ncbi:MAG: hypothetical protein AB8B72_11340 [Crocinitomicaceae bacterium]